MDVQLIIDHPLIHVSRGLSLGWENTAICMKLSSHVLYSRIYASLPLPLPFSALILQGDRDVWTDDFSWQQKGWIKQLIKNSPALIVGRLLFDGLSCVYIVE